MMNERHGVPGMSLEQFVAFARRALSQAGVQAQVALGGGTADDEEEIPAKAVSVLTDQPYEAWKVLARQTDPVLERSGPSSISERFYGIDVVIDSRA